MVSFVSKYRESNCGSEKIQREQGFGEQQIGEQCLRPTNVK